MRYLPILLILLLPQWMRPHFVAVLYSIMAVRIHVGAPDC
jgi:hypothetical protein